MSVTPQRDINIISNRMGCANCYMNLPLGVMVAFTGKIVKYQDQGGLQGFATPPNRCTSDHYSCIKTTLRCLRF